MYVYMWDGNTEGLCNTDPATRVRTLPTPTITLLPPSLLTTQRTLRREEKLSSSGSLATLLRKIRFTFECEEITIVKIKNEIHMLAYM